LAKWTTDIARNLSGWTPEVEAYFRRHAWPGKVRELENTIERVVVLARGDRMTLDDLLLSGEAITSPDQDLHAATNLQEFLNHAAVQYSKKSTGCAEKPRVVLGLTARPCTG
jgi:transcriptional regulator with PAS, ATPase and Fis domain